ncbi:MAG TPA: competence/damage-inducible protein A [Vicinamibacterales bacterium]|nr:competence/damage-inducible protein A [Vicinamibacterales bacterium]
MADVKPLARAAVIAVGSELLTPLRVDTNSLFITEQLNQLGIVLTAKAVVGDDRNELASTFRHFLERVDLVICCGGLGPTDDDVTREVVASVLELELREDEALTEQMRARFAARGYGTAMPEINRRQAMVPDGARVIANGRGSAPGLWIESRERLVLLLPGPPRELKPMLTDLVAGPLRARGAGVPLARRVLKIAGRIESQTEEELQPLYREWRTAPVPVDATILAALGQLELHLTARSASREQSDRVLEAAVRQVLGVLGDDVFTTVGAPLEQVVGEMLASRGLRIAAAESCTGGLLTSRLTDIPGSSGYVDRAVVSYSNAAKTDLLGVPADLIAAHGAVSEPVAAAMADGIRLRSSVEVGVGITGIAGPGGGSTEKPVGTVAVAVSTAEERRVRTFRFNGEREQVKFQASQAGLDMVRRLLLS